MGKRNNPPSLEEVRRALSVRITELRTTRGKTQLQISQASGLALQYLTKIEQGSRSPSLKTLVALAHALEIPLYELFNFEDRDITNPRAEIQILDLRRRLAGATEADIKLLNHLADRLAAGPVRKPKKGRS